MLRPRRTVGQVRVYFSREYMRAGECCPATANVTGCSPVTRNNNRKIFGFRMIVLPEVSEGDNWGASAPLLLQCYYSTPQYPGKGRCEGATLVALLASGASSSSG